ncbi:MAG: hypothetical protein OEL66_05510 [Desulfobulbaceae bacterium]|nr:hypothetical protein [Desulfobulbaceae bacterium]
MNFKRLVILLAMALMVGSFSVLFAGCAGMNGETTYHMVPEKMHDAEFPDGHSGRSHAECIYDQDKHVYFCPF